MMRHITDENLVGKMYPYYGKSMSTNFLGFLHAMVFFAFFPAMGKWWGNPFISHMMKYTTGWESNGKGMGTNFLGFAHLIVLAEFSHAIGN